MIDKTELQLGDWWRFYCWRCEQWCERAGPWCDLYADEGRTDPCYFDEYPERRAGVRFPQDMPPQDPDFPGYGK